MKYEISIRDIHEIQYHLAEEDEETAIEYLLDTFMAKMSLDQYANEYTNNMLKYAQQLGPDTPMGQACLQRGEHVMDFIEAYREYLKKP